MKVANTRKGWTDIGKVYIQQWIEISRFTYKENGDVQLFTKIFTSEGHHISKAFHPTFEVHPGSLLHIFNIFMTDDIINHIFIENNKYTSRLSDSVFNEKFLVKE